jgi:hypothetical protein
MDKKENAYLGMVGRTLHFCDQTSSVWNSFSVFVKEINAIKELHSSGNLLLKEKTETVPLGFTTAKDNKFEQMTQKALKLAKKVASFAKVNGLVEILPLVDYSQSSLKDGPEKEIMNRCTVISEKALKYIDQLADYQVSRIQIDELNALIEEYRVMPDIRDNVKITKKVTGHDIQKVIKSIRQHFTILDDMVEGLIDDENFQDNYFEARMIIDRGARKSVEETELAVVK